MKEKEEIKVAKKKTVELKPDISLEANMKRLETIAETLNSGEQSLEDCLKLYEEGVKLAKTCLDELENTKGKITEIKGFVEEDIDG